MVTEADPSGVCPKCKRYLDDHNGWLLKHGPYCPPKKERMPCGNT